MQRWLVMLAVSCAPALVHGAEREVVAVFEIDVRDAPGFASVQASKFTALLDSVVTAAGYRTVPRAEIQARLVEQQAESFRPCYDDSCQIEIGKSVAAKKAFSATWARFGETCTLSVKLYDLRSAVAEFSTKADAACDEAGLRASVEQVGVALRSRGQQGYGAFTLDLEESRQTKNPPTDRNGYLKIKAEAKGRPGERIEVYVNGDLAGSVANGLFTKELPVGRYIVLLRTAGDLFAHQRFDIELTSAGAQVPKEGLLQLQPMFGALVLEGIPRDATAVIDGEPRAVRGMLREDRRVGSYSVIFEAPGYIASVPQQVTIVPGKTARVTYALERNAGAIGVTGAPGGAIVLVDGTEAGKIPLTIANVDTGDHLVEVTAPGHHTAKRMVSVRRGERAGVDARLTRMVARLKVEALAKVGGSEVPVEAEVRLNGARVGITPWKAEILAAVPHMVELWLGNRRAGKRAVNLPEGSERREVIEVPSAWAGAVSSLRFEVGGGPVEIRSGPATLALDEPNPVRAGRLPLEFYVEGQRVGGGAVIVVPDENRVVTVVDRPRTPEELESSRHMWTWRKWISVGAVALAGSVAIERTVAARRAESDRDAAYAALRASSISDDVDTYRAAVVAREDDRASAENVALGVGIGLLALGAWSVYEWIFGEPSSGAFVVEGLDEVGR